MTWSPNEEGCQDDPVATDAHRQDQHQHSGVWQLEALYQNFTTCSDMAVVLLLSMLLLHSQGELLLSQQHSSGYARAATARVLVLLLCAELVAVAVVTTLTGDHLLSRLCSATTHPVAVSLVMGSFTW